MARGQIAGLSCHWSFAGDDSNNQNVLQILDTERLVLRELGDNDAPFILQLVNEPSWLRFIGDKGIKTVEAARGYIQKGPVEMYARFGFGLWLVELKEERVPIGICGLIKRESLEDIDLGYAFLPAYWGRGYAFESASATMSHGKSKFGLKRLVAVMAPDNDASDRLLGKLGFRFERMVQLSNGSPELKLYAVAI